MLRNLSFRWEYLLIVTLLLVILINVQLSEHFLEINNLVNVFHLSIEKVIVVLPMTFLIINGEIDLSVASIMGLSACLFAGLYSEQGASPFVAIGAALAVGALCGLFNGFWISWGGLPSLVVTLAGLITFRGIARILLEDRSAGGFPEWFDALGQPDFLGPLSAGMVIFFVLFLVFAGVLHFTAFGRYTYIIGNNDEAARFAGVRVGRNKLMLYILSGVISSLAGLLMAARMGSVRANVAEGFELDIITIVLLGGVSIFGGTGTLAGVGLSILVVLNLRNGMSLANYPGNVQTSVVGVLLILSVLIPNIGPDVLKFIRERTGQARTQAERSA